MVIGLTNEARGLVDKFVADTKATHPIVIEGSDSAQTFGISGFPSSFLIDADGKVAWSGHPGNLTPELIEAQLKNVRLVPQLPAKLSAAQALLDKRKFGDARKLLEKAAADEKASDEDRKAATDAVAWLDDNAQRHMKSAAEDAAKDPFSASEAYSDLAEQYKGTETASAAEKALKDLLSDPAVKKEIDCTRKFADVKARIRDLKPKKAIPIVKGFLSGAKGTKVATQAEELLRTLEAADK